MFVPSWISKASVVLSVKVGEMVSVKKATVPEAFWKVMVLLETVGSAIAKVVVTLSSVVPSKTRGEAPRI